MSHYESKPETTEKQLWLSHVNEFLKMISEFSRTTTGISFVLLPQSRAHLCNDLAKIDWLTS